MNNTERAILGVLIGGGLGYLAYNILSKSNRSKEAVNYALFGIVLLALYEYRDFKTGKDSFWDFGSGGRKSKGISSDSISGTLNAF